MARWIKTLERRFDRREAPNDAPRFVEVWGETEDGRKEFKGGMVRERNGAWVFIDNLAEFQALEQQERRREDGN